MADARNGVLVALCLLVVGPGCHKRSTRPAGATSDPKNDFEAPAWSASADGLQCRLRPTKRLWRVGETPTFRVDLRNGGQRVFALAVEPLRPDRIAIDRQWYQPPRAGVTGRKMVAFGPAADFADLPLILPSQMTHLLPKGRHVVQIAFRFEGIEVRSNPVEIDIAD